MPTISKNIIDEYKTIKKGLFKVDDVDDLFDEAVKIIVKYDRASASLIQRRLRIGYARAARLLDELETAGVVGPGEGAKPRDVLIKSAEEFTRPADKVKEDEVFFPEIPEYKPLKIELIKKPIDSPWKNSLFDAINNSSFKNAEELSFLLGFGQSNKLISRSLKDFSHLVITGSATSKKEAILDTIITSLIAKEAPNNIKLILIDSTNYLSLYEGIWHLLTPPIKEPNKADSALKWTISEMDRRFKLFSEARTRNVEAFNQLSGFQALPHILIVINQLDEFFKYSESETKDTIKRLTVFGQKAGIHFFATTNRLVNADIPANIQADIPNKLSFRLNSQSDAGEIGISNVEKLQKGEAILVSDFENEPQKLNCVYTSDENIKQVVKFVIYPEL